MAQGFNWPPREAGRGEPAARVSLEDCGCVVIGPGSDEGQARSSGYLSAWNTAPGLEYSGDNVPANSGFLIQLEAK